MLWGVEQFTVDCLQYMSMSYSAGTCLSEDVCVKRVSE